MSIEWKKGPPPPRTAGHWIVWMGDVVSGVYREPADAPLLWTVSHASAGCDPIDYHAEITPPEEESPAPSPREGAESSEGEGEGKGAPQWTRGPWEVGNTIGGSIMVFADRAGGNEARGMIASCDAGNYARSPEKGRANANLIKTAPDLYEALDGLVNGMHSPATYEEAIRKADAILAKARGGGS